MLTNVKSRLSRQYVHAGLKDLNFNLSTATVHNVALMENPTEEPNEETDWYEAIVVIEGHPLYNEDIGKSLAILVGPARGDTVTTRDLGPGFYLVWSDTMTSESAERIVGWHGTIEIKATP